MTEEEVEPIAIGGTVEVTGGPFTINGEQVNISNTVHWPHLFASSTDAETYMAEHEDCNFVAWDRVIIVPWWRRWWWKIRWHLWDKRHQDIYGVDREEQVHVKFEDQGTVGELEEER